MAEYVDLKRTLFKRTMIHILNLDRKEYLQFEGTLSELSGTSAHAFPVFHLLCQGSWASQRIVIFENSPPSLAGYVRIYGMAP